MDEVERLIKQLGNEDKYVRGQAVAALGKIGDTRAVEPLCRALGDEDKDVRKRAAAALGSIGRREALPALKARLPRFGRRGEQDEEVLAAIRAAIKKIEKATAATTGLPRHVGEAETPTPTGRPRKAEDTPTPERRPREG